MLPVYRCMDSNPHERNQMPFAQHYRPSFETVPPHMKMDPTQFPCTHEYWPYSGNCGYPIQCHSCCNHNYFPGYYNFRPPCHPPQPQFHYMGGFPAFSYPLHYAPPHYWTGQPRCEYDDYGAKEYHCHGCPNHKRNLKEDRNVKIEDQEPEVGKKGADSLVPVDLKNNPYPVVWIPPGFLRSKEHQKPFASEVTEQVKMPCDTKLHDGSASLEQDPISQNGWFPIDLNRFGSLNQGEGDKRTQKHQDGSEKSELPFPVIWMPSFDKLKKGERESEDGSNSPKFVEEQLGNFKLIPTALSENDDSTKNPGANEENSGGSKLIDKTANPKLIPVKQMEQHEENMALENVGGRVREIPVKFMAESGEEKPSENGSKRMSSSPPKTSKLPPVCLRIDPLPKRKNSNGCSRSPSPPGKKEKLQEVSTNLSKLPISSELEEKAPKNMPVPVGTLNMSNLEMNQNERSVIEVSEQAAAQNCDEGMRKGSQTQGPVNLLTTSREGVGKGEGECETKAALEEALKTEKEINGDVFGDDECKTKRGTLGIEEKKCEGNIKMEKFRSAAELATVIQSAYRGFEVRKWEPLKKLKQIAKVREQVDEIRNRIQALESFSSLEEGNKGRMVIGESIMSLFLKLDTIQGLHPIIRDIRKSVARELARLQERLDSLMTKKPTGPVEEISALKPKGEYCGCTHDNSTIQGGQTKQSEVGDNNVESNCDSSSNFVEPCDHHSLLMTDDGSQDFGASETLMVENVTVELENNIEEDSTSLVDLEASEPETFLKLEEENNKNLEVSQVMKAEVEMNGHKLELHHSADLLSAAGEKINPELSLTVSSTECLESDLDAPKSVDAVVDDSATAYKELEMSHLWNLPNEEPILLENHEQIETQKNEILWGGDRVPEVVTDENPQEEEAPAMDQVEQQEKQMRKSENWAEIEQDKHGEFCEKTGQGELLEQSYSEEEGDHENELANIPQPEGTHSSASASAVEGPAADALVAPEEKEMRVEVMGEDNMKQQVAVGEKDAVLLNGKPQDESVTGNRGMPVPPNVSQTMEAGNVNQPMAAGEEGEQIEGLNEAMPEQKIQSQEPECVVVNNEMADHSETAEEEKYIPPEEQDRETESDNKVIEENKKLREMMEKLVEAGKEQLAVISKLTGRVKDLETKMSRNKKLRSRSRRATAPRSYRAKSLNNSPKERPAGAM